VDFSSFQCVIFSCKWHDTFDWSNEKEDCDSGLVCIKSKKCGLKQRSLMFFQNTTTKCFYPDMLNQDWWFILRHDLRLKCMFEKNNFIMSSEEDNRHDGNEE
jgi:hypothetical protein